MSVPIFFTEAALKALALRTIGLEAIGLCGVEVGAKDPEYWGLTRLLTLHPLLKSFLWKDRLTYVSFDAGAQKKPSVALAQARLSLVLDQEGASVLIVTLPERTRFDPDDEGADDRPFVVPEFGDQGPDDFIFERGPEAYMALAENAVPGNPLRWVERVIEQAKANDPDVKRDEIGRRLSPLLQDMRFVSLLEVYPRAIQDQVAKELRRYAAVGTRAINDAVERFQRSRAAEPDERGVEQNHPYTVRDGRTYKATAGGEVVIAEFAAVIERDVMIDDGFEQTRAFEITGQLPSGEKLRRLTVPVKDFAGMDWVLEGWGAKATIPAGRDIREQFRAALQYLSVDAKQAEQARVYAHTGWIRHGEKWVYLHGGGAIGTDDQLKVSCNARFNIGPTGQDLPAAIRHSLAMLTAAPKEVSIPMFASLPVAPLCSHVGSNTTLWVCSPSGSKKSGLVGLIEGHQGSFTWNEHLTNFNCTAMHIANVGFVYKDALVVCDDWHPDSVANRKAGFALDDLFHTLGDNAGRGRVDRNGRNKDGKPIRGQMVFTGEGPPPITAIGSNARVVVLEVKPGQISLDRILDLEARRHLAQQAWRGYLEWLAPQLDDPTPFRELKAAETKRFRSLLPAGTHDRVPASLGVFSMGMRLYVRYALESKALTQSQSEALIAAVDQALLALGEKQVDNLQGKSLGEQFQAAVRKLCRSGRIKLLPPQDTLDVGTDLQCTAVGWDPGETDPEHVYFDPDVLWDCVVRNFRQLGEEWKPKPAQIYGALADEGVIKRDGKNLRAKRIVAGGRPRVLVVRREWLDDSTEEDREAFKAAKNRAFQEVQRQGEAQAAAVADYIANSDLSNTGVPSAQATCCRSTDVDVTTLSHAQRDAYLAGDPGWRSADDDPDNDL